MLRSRVGSLGFTSYAMTRSPFLLEASLPGGEDNSIGFFYRIRFDCTSLHRMMRRTGKLYTLTMVSSLLTVLASFLLILWSKNSSPIHLWVDIVPQSFGLASLVTCTLIVGHLANVSMFSINSLYPHTQAMIGSVTKEDMAVATGSKGETLCAFRLLNITSQSRIYSE